MRLPILILLLLGIGARTCQADEEGDDSSDGTTTNAGTGVATNSSAIIRQLIDDIYEAYGKSKLNENRTNIRRIASRRLVLESVINRTVGATGLSPQDARRMTVIQVTFAIMISVLLVADIFLAWSFSYLVMHYEKRGRMALRYYRTLVTNRW